MRVNIQKPFYAGRPPLPEPPFVIRLASPDDWNKFLDDYPELEEMWKWASGDRLRLINPRSAEFRFFYEDLGVRHANYINRACEGWPVVEYPG